MPHQLRYQSGRCLGEKRVISWCVSNVIQAEVGILANDGIFLHDGEVGASDYVAVTCGSNEDVGAWRGVLHSRNFIASHGSLESVNRVDLGDQDSSTI